MNAITLNTAAQTAHSVVLVLQSDKTLWYLTRAAAISAYALLALTATLGLLRSLTRTAAIRNRGIIWTLDELHQFSALLAAAFVVLHLGTLLLDSYLPFSLPNLLVPLGEPYRPLATDLGVLALYALAIVLISSWLRGRLKHGTWRALHYTSFVAFALVTVHGLLAGTDAGQPWMTALYVGVSASVVLLVTVRIVLSVGRGSQRDAAAAALARHARAR